MTKGEAIVRAWRMCHAALRGMQSTGWPWEYPELCGFLNDEGRFTLDGMKMKSALYEVITRMDRFSRPRKRGKG